MYPNKKTEQTCKLVSLGGILLVILALAAAFGALKSGGKGVYGFPKLRGFGYLALVAAGGYFIFIGRYGIRELLQKYLMTASFLFAGFFATQIISGISLFMKVDGFLNVLYVGAAVFAAILGVFFCVFFGFDAKKKYFNLRYDQIVMAAMAGLNVVVGLLMVLYSYGGDSVFRIRELERFTGAGVHVVMFVLPAAILWFCDRLTEPFTDNEVAQVRVAERQAIKIAEAQKATEQYNKITAEKAAERRRREEEIAAKEAAAKRRLEEEKQARIEAEKRAAELEVQKAKEKAEQEAREAEEQAKRAAEEEIRRQEEIKRQLEEAQKAAEEAQRRAEEEARRAAEAAEEARRKAEEEVKRAQEAQEEARRRAEQLRESALRKAEAAKAEAAKKEEEIRKKQAAEAAAKAEQVRIDEEEKAKNDELERRRAELEARRREKEAQRRIEAEQRRAEEEALAMMTPEERKIYEEEKALMEQEEALRKADEEARAEALREVEAYRRAEEELRATAEEETKKKLETLQMALSAGLITKEEYEARKAKITG